VKQVDLGFKSDVKNRFPEHRALFAAGEQIQSLTAHPGWAVVLEMLDDRIAALDAKLDGANPLEHVWYAHLHGERRGLRAAREAAYALESVYVDELQEQQRKHEAGAESPAER
jgi:CHAD domain-containing protein